MDLKYDRVFNGWILFGILLGLCFRIRENGWIAVLDAVFPMILSFVLLYPIYKIGGMGAGDVKLFFMIGSFVSAEWLLYLMLYSFVIGAVFSIGKVLLEKNCRKRIEYFFSYLTDLFYSRQWKLYGEDLLQDSGQYKSNKIHFALPVFIGAMLGLGGLF